MHFHLPKCVDACFGFCVRINCKKKKNVDKSFLCPPAWYFLQSLVRYWVLHRVLSYLKLKTFPEVVAASSAAYSLGRIQKNESAACKRALGMILVHSIYRSNHIGFFIFWGTLTCYSAKVQIVTHLNGFRILWLNDKEICKCRSGL